MNKFKSIKKQLKFCIQSMEASSSLFVVNPERDFTRRRKHLFGNTMMNVLLLEAGSLKDELFGLFGYTLDVPSVSSSVQARDKIRPDAFCTLFKRFNEKLIHRSYIRVFDYWQSMALCCLSVMPCRTKKRPS